MADRRLFLTLLMLGLCSPALSAFAKDGEGGGKSDSGGGNGSGKGSDGGKDDNGKDDNDRDADKDDRDDDKDDRDDKKDDDKDKDDDKIRDAVARGDAEPLKDILKAVRQRYKGKVVNIRLAGEGRNLQYRIKLIDANDRLIEVRVNARTARIVGSR